MSLLKQTDNRRKIITNTKADKDIPVISSLTMQAGEGSLLSSIPLRIVFTILKRKANHKFLYQYSMCKTLLPAAKDQTASNSSDRAAHVSLFFELKEKLKILSRQTLFLGIAICDKLLERKVASPSPSVLEGRTEVRVVACLLLAWKFAETDKIPVKKLLQKVGHPTMTSEEVVDMEAEILEGIDFQIPACTTYASMTAAFCSLEADRSRQAVIAGQCLKFLQEAVRLSSDFSLCADLGAKIVRLYMQRCLQDRRIHSVYMEIQRRNSPPQAQSITAP